MNVFEGRQNSKLSDKLSSATETIARALMASRNAADQNDEHLNQVSELREIYDMKFQCVNKIYSIYILHLLISSA